MQSILCRNQQTVAAILRVMGLSDEKHFINFIVSLTMLVGLDYKILKSCLDCSSYLYLYLFLSSSVLMIPLNNEKVKRLKVAIVILFFTEAYRQMLWSQMDFYDANYSTALD